MAPLTFNGVRSCIVRRERSCQPIKSSDRTGSVLRQNEGLEIPDCFKKRLVYADWRTGIVQYHTGPGDGDAVYTVDHNSNVRAM